MPPVTADVTGQERAIPDVPESSVRKRTETSFQQIDYSQHEGKYSPRTSYSKATYLQRHHHQWLRDIFPFIYRQVKATTATTGKICTDIYHIRKRPAATCAASDIIELSTRRIPHQLDLGVLHFRIGSTFARTSARQTNRTNGGRGGGRFSVMAVFTDLSAAISRRYSKPAVNATEFPDRIYLPQGFSMIGLRAACARSIGGSVGGAAGC